jgi:hypothetical protein
LQEITVEGTLKLLKRLFCVGTSEFTKIFDKMLPYRKCIVLIWKFDRFGKQLG